MYKIRLVYITFLLYYLPADARVFINYVQKITNNSNSSFKIYCDNFLFRPVLFMDASNLSNLRVRGETKQTPAQLQFDLLSQERDSLLNEKRDLAAKLLREQGYSNEQINKNARMQDINKRLDQLTEQMRPVIGPKQIFFTDPNITLPCRLFGPADKPTTGDIKNWKMPELYLKSDTTTIYLMEAERGSCDIGYIKIEAHSKTYKTSICLSNQSAMGRIHLIINPDETFSLQEIKTWSTTEAST